MAMGWLLTTRASMDAHHRKQVSDTEAAFCKNEAKATETIRKAKACCVAVIWEAEAASAVTIWEAEAACSVTIQEAEAAWSAAIRKVEAACAAAIREAETTCADCSNTLQQMHRDSMQGLERDAIKKEGRDCQSFLATCRAALQACSSEAHGALMYPLQLLMGNMSLATLLAIHPRHPLAWRNLSL